jgi:uncharacterized caspase-like protein
MNKLASRLCNSLAASLLALLVLLPAAAQDTDRVAIVMGNGAYLHTASLPNPPNDARRISQALEPLGFQVHTIINASKQDLERLHNDIGKLMGRADVGLFFYAGHGLQINGENFMVPVDASFDDVQDLSNELVSLTRFLSRMEEYTATNIIFLDACRNNPLADVLQDQMSAGRSLSVGSEQQVRSVGQGLAEMKASVGTLIAYATQPGILRHISEPGVEIREILTLVRVSVLGETNRRQIPWDHSSLTEEFYFIDPVKPKDIPLPPP